MSDDARELDLFDGGQTAAELEAMSRDLILLTRTIGIYPDGHPQVTHMVGRLVEWVRAGQGETAIGVTGSELVVDRQFFGGKDTRAEMLAHFLHLRKIARLTWLPQVKNQEVYDFARLLAEQSLEGDELVLKMDEAKVEAIVVVPLDLGVLHDRLKLAETGEDENEARRRKEIWLWLQGESGSPREVARALSSEDFWDTVYGGSKERLSEFVEVLSRLGSVIDRALGHVPEEQRAMVNAKLSELGGSLGPEDMAKLVDVHLADNSSSGEALSALMKHVDGERLVGLMGGLVSLGGPKEQRLGAFIQQFVPPEQLLSMAGIAGRYSESGEKMGMTTEVWQWLDSYLCDYDEDAYMGEGYRETLDRMASRLRTQGERGAAFGFFEDAESHLDRVHVGLSLEETDSGKTQLYDRITGRMEELDPLGVLDFLEMIDRASPQSLDNRNDVMEKLFRDVVADIRDFPTETRKRLILFARRHEKEMLDIALRTLLEEERMSVRRFLVELLCNMSSATVPRIVQSTRLSPWYFIRNCAIILGRIGDARAFPFLYSQLNHEDNRVRKEALRAMGAMGNRGKKALTEYSMDIMRPTSERDMARNVLARMRSA